MSTGDQHILTTSQEQRMDGGEWYRCRCCCGYASGLRNSPGSAQRCGQAHKEAKERNEQNRAENTP